MGTLKIVSFNGHSVRKKLESIMPYADDKGIDMIFIQETWIRKSDGHLITYIKEHGYVPILYRKTRRLDLGGGVAVLHKQNLKVQNISCNKFRSFEHIECQVHTEQGPIKFVNVYRPDYSKKNRYTVKKFLQEFSELLSGYAISDMPCFLIGDYNIHVELKDKNISTECTPSQVKKIKDAKDFIKVIGEHDFCQLIDEETHNLHGTLDLLLTRRENISLIQDLDIGYENEICKTDHFPLKFHLSLNPVLKDKMVTITKRNFSNFDVNAFHLEVSRKLDIENVLNCDINSCVMLYNNTLQSALDKQCPVSSRTVHLRPKQKWFNQELRELKRNKRAIERKWKKNKTAWWSHQLDAIKLLYKNAIFETRTKYITASIDRIGKNDHKRIHKAVNYLTGNDQEKILPSHTSKEELANLMTEFYSNKVVNIRKSILPSEVNTDNSEICSSSFSTFCLVSKDDLRKIIHKMKPKGHPNDPIPVWLVKDSLDALAPALLHIVNKSLQQSFFPDSLKHASVSPDIKERDGDQEAFKNYRPVSNLPFLSKLLEKCASTQLEAYLWNNNLYPNFQSAYRKDHSCETALLKIVNDIQEEIETRKLVALIALDLSSAFDTIDHSHLLHKLERHFGITGDVLKWINSYLTNRTFAVRIGHVEGKPVLLIYGVPQGSILGPLLFILYMHDLVGIAAEYGLCIHLYADDAELYIGFSPLTQSSLTMINVKECILGVQSWMDSNFLKINIGKTNVIFFGRTQELNLFNVDIDIDGKYFESSPDSVIKTLGIYLDSKLSMNNVVTECCKTCYFQLRKLQSIRRFLSVEKKTLMVHSHILSRLDYCNVLLAGLSATQTKKLQRVLNAGVRFIYNLSKRQSVQSYAKTCHFLPVKFRIYYKSCLTVYKIINGMAPDYLMDFALHIVRNRQNLRSASDNLILQLPTCNKTLRFHLIKSWNVLPFELRSISSIEHFKTSLKTFYFRQAYD